jgi:DNA (cytosine-5)-methyltransferase 1
MLRPRTPADVAKVNQRVASGIRQFDSGTAPVGFSDPVAYATRPRTGYQRAMRRGDQPTVKYHFTDKSTPFPTEASATVPLEPNANHKREHLPYSDPYIQLTHRPDLPPEFFAHSTLKRVGPACFGRLNADGCFKTAVTTVKPRSRGSYVLHPEVSLILTSYVLYFTLRHPSQQYRAISVLEAKRAQGFPDDYILWSGAQSKTGQISDVCHLASHWAELNCPQYYRQIGNAVPVPLAAALGRSLQAAFVETWKRMPREGSPEL